MIFWNAANIETGMLARGWANARQLSKGAHISYPAAWAIAQGGAIGRIDTRTLEALAKAFGVHPCTLLDWTPD